MVKIGNGDGMKTLQSLGENIWMAEGPVVEGAAGFHFPTRMVVIRLSNGDLWIWSPVAPVDDLIDEVRQLGPVRWIVAPNDLHHLNVGLWAEHFPGINICAVPRLVEKRPDLTISHVFGNDPIAEWQGDLEQVIFDGNLILTEIVFFHRASGTAIFTDLLQQMPGGWFAGWRGLVAKLDYLTEDEPAVPRKFRWAFVRKRRLREKVAIVFDWPVGQVVMAHGQPVLRGAGAFLRRAFAWCGPIGR